MSQDGPLTSSQSLCFLFPENDSYRRTSQVRLLPSQVRSVAFSSGTLTNTPHTKRIAYTYSLSEPRRAPWEMIRLTDGRNRGDRGTHCGPVSPTPCPVMLCCLLKSSPALGFYLHLGNWQMLPYRAFFSPSLSCRRIQLACPWASVHAS